METTLKKPTPFISGSMLKLIAMITMLIDHTAVFLFSGFPFFTDSFLTLADRGISLYYLCRLIGRLAFPLYCFLLTEGFLHTKDRTKYGLRLLGFALLSELPWNFAHTGSLLYGSQNVMFTLFFGYLALCALEAFEKDKLKQAVALILLFLVCSFGRIDYGVRGLGLILVLYLLQHKPVEQAIVGSCLLSNGWAAGLAFIPINLYNRKRGFMTGAVGKYAGYLFYPVHLLLLGLLRYFLLR